MYGLIQKIILPLLKLFFIVKKNSEAWDRRFPVKYKKSDRSIWFHAASVGEVNAVKPLINRIIKESGFPVFMTVMTETGFKVASETEGLTDVLLFPFDSIAGLKKIVRAKNPLLLLIAETEIWPGMIDTAYRNNIPVVICNARLTEKSLNSYRKINFIVKKIFPKIKEVLAQSEIDCDHFKTLGLKNVINDNLEII